MKLPKIVERVRRAIECTELRSDSMASLRALPQARGSAARFEGATGAVRERLAVTLSRVRGEMTLQYRLS